MSTILSRIVLPKSNRMAQSDLYYHTNGVASLKSGVLVIAKGNTVRFDSYFNAFFYPKYLRYTHISVISLHLRLSGQVRLRVLCNTRDGDKDTVFEDDISEERIDLPICKLSDLPPEGMLFFELEAKSETVRFSQGWYATEEIVQNEVKVAIVICTYRREEYVVRNLKQLQQELWADVECPIRNFLDVFVIDNGKTLVLEEMPHVQIVFNKNCGGSGGFTRGLIEAYRRKQEYTHVLFMDDDISFETETLVKTVQLLRFAKQLERPLCIGGQMLIEDSPTLQFEAGAYFRNGRVVSMRHGFDLTEPDTLLENEAERDTQYTGWWYCCFPLETVKQIGLPLPFFIKADDLEYGLRMKPYFVLMNGIGVWHTDFSRKYSPHLEYYIKRNELVVSALHDSGFGILPSMWKLVRASGKAALIGNPKTIDFMLWAYQDFLEGPDFFLRVDGEWLNQRLLQEKEKPTKGRFCSILTDPFRLLPVLAAVFKKYRIVQRQYKDRFTELTGMDFWCSYLGLDPVQANANGPKKSYGIYITAAR